MRRFAPHDDPEEFAQAARWEGGIVAARKPFLLRMSPELWEELSRWAADELRSVNGHVEFLLREAVRQRRRASEAARKRAGPDAAEGGGASPSGS